MSFNLKQLQAFVWVADLGSFRKAADRLNTTQPNISSRIAALESSLKLTLMERDAGSVRLTTKGRELLDHARRVLNATDALIEASNRTALYEGVLKLGVTELVANTWLRDYLRCLRDEFPTINVELTVDLSINLSKELFDRNIDLTLQSEPFNRLTSGNEYLGTYPWVWVAAPSLGLVTDQAATMEEMASFPILAHARNTRNYEDLIAHFSQCKGLNLRLMPSTNLSACIHMAVDSMGVAILPEAMIVRELARGELVPIQYDWVPESLRFMARYDAERSPLFVSKAASLAVRVARNHERALTEQV